MNQPLWIVIVVTIVILAILVFPRIRRHLRERELTKKLQQLGVECLRSVVLKDILEEGMYIDCMVLMPDRVVILDIKRYRGNIFAALNMDMWTQVIGRRSFRFPNPLHKLEADVAAINSVVPGIKIDGFVVFSQESRFPKGQPAGVIGMEELFTRFTLAEGQEVAPQVIKAWGTLSARLISERVR